MKKLFAVVLIATLAQKAVAQDSTVRKLDEMITAYANTGRFNGSALVAKQGEILLQKGYGLKNTDNNSMNDEHTVYQIASVTKQFTATVVLKMIELKKMSLSDKLNKYYPGFPNGDSITIEHLLTHTSGLHNFTEGDSDITETDEKRMVPYLKTLKPDFAPGTDWHYSNSGYVMLGFIIQKVSGLTYFQAVRKYIFEPLKMGSSGFDFTHLASPNKAVGYNILNDTLKQPAVITDSTVPFGAGAIYSTLQDMYRWHRGLQAYAIVSKQLMDKAYTACPQHNYGYGWQIDSIFGRKMVSHSGSISGFGSNFARITGDDICIVLLSNKGGSTFDVMNITDKLLAILYNQPYCIPVKRTPVKLSDGVLKKYTGTYEIEEMHLTVEITVNNGQLIAQPYRGANPGPPSAMLATDEKHFYDERDQETEIAFDINSEGKVLGVNILQRGMAKYAKKIK